ncbi:phasin family protein [uncultured Ferrimonas sp.]|uniref:phasin family protein n=1 Tax=uncultured Ferrimonas sp. TaxID=432640 RepID=UPI00262C08C2|nr:phasin family protein [uncultured Ferrimonas sp.]
MLNDIKQQMEDGLQRSIEQQVKLQELQTQLLTEVATRNNEYLTEVLKSGSEIGQGLSECRTPMQLLDKQSELASSFSSKAEAYVKSNMDTLTSFSTTVAELTKAYWQVPATADAPKRKAATK